VFTDALTDLKGTHLSLAGEAGRQAHGAAAMPLRSSVRPVRSQLTVDNPTEHDVRVYQLDENGQAHLKRIIAPYLTVTDDTYEGLRPPLAPARAVGAGSDRSGASPGTVFFLADDKTGARLGWVQVLAHPTLIRAPVQALDGGNGQVPQELLPAYSETATF
jgi:hypothetical protein